MKTCKELKRLSRELLMGNYRIAMGALITAIGIPLLIDLPFSSLLNIEHGTRLQLILYYLAEFFIQIVSGVLQIGMISMFLSLGRKQSISSRQVFFCFKKRSDFFIVGYFIKLIMDLITLSPIIAGIYIFTDYQNPKHILYLIGLGIISIILFVFINIIYSLVFYVMLDHDELNIFQCYKKARQLIKGSKARYLYTQLSFIGLELLALISFGIGLLWVEPYRQMTLANFYLDIVEPKNSFNASV